MGGRECKKEREEKRRVSEKFTFLHRAKKSVEGDVGVVVAKKKIIKKDS